VGSQTYALQRDLLSPTKPADKTFADIQKVLTDQYEPKPLVTAEQLLVDFVMLTVKSAIRKDTYVARVRM